MCPILCTLLMLPCIALAGVYIDIYVDKTKSEAWIQSEGEIREIIPEKERDVWKLKDGQLKDAVKAYDGGRPDDAYLKSPTPWNDLYSTNRWPQVQRSLSPINAIVLGIKSQPVIVNTQEFVNNTTKTANFKAEVTQNVVESVSSTWSKEVQLQIGQEISYNVEYGVGEVGGTTSISYTNSWGESTTKSRSVTVGSSSGIEVPLEPGQSVVATLTASRGTMKIQINYEATLFGYAACNFSGRYKGHYFWAYDINECLSAAGSPTTIESSETLEIAFYSDAKVVLTDRKPYEMLLKVRA